MSDQSGVRITVIDPAAAGTGSTRTGVCRLSVESARPLPRSHRGTVRVRGLERPASGCAFAVRLLKHYEITRIDDAASRRVRRVLYSVRVDLGDESCRNGAAYVAPGLGVRTPDEPVSEVCRRIAGTFGRFCERYRPPSVSVELAR